MQKPFHAVTLTASRHPVRGLIFYCTSQFAEHPYLCLLRYDRIGIEFYVVYAVPLR